LDLTNAYNNVVYDVIYPALGHYLGENALGVLRICQAIKYIDIPLGEQYMYMKRNKGIPQGSPLSMDLFIIIMDWIIRDVIDTIETQYHLYHNTDYQIICYVDDIQILFKTTGAQAHIDKILDCFDTVLSNYHFILNRKKCYKSRHPEISHCPLPEYGSEEKYLGIYLEKDRSTYLKIVEKYIATKYPQNTDMKSLEVINETLPDYKNKTNGERIIKSLRGIFQYKLRPFAKTREELHDFFVELGYANIADNVF
jgi:hypothetical protein